METAMESTRETAIHLGVTLAIIVAIAAPPWRAWAVENLSSQESAAWVCAGPVNGCTKTDDPTTTGGCKKARGTGRDPDAAMGKALDACQAQLHGAPGGTWTCSDTSGLTCEPPGVGR